MIEGGFAQDTRQDGGQLNEIVWSARYSQIDPMTEKFEAILGYHGTPVDSIFKRTLQLANI
jgi:hypothetical protein